MKLSVVGLHQIKGGMMQQYQCVDARKGTMKNGSITKPVLILELMSTDDQSTATKFFQCELTAKKNYSVPRNSDYAKLYRLTFGESPDSRFSRSDRLLKHFIGEYFYCETKLSTDKKTGDCYQKVVDIKPLIIKKNAQWTDAGTKLKKTRNSQNTLGKKLATTWQENGNNLAKFCQQLGNDKSLQPAETLGLQPFSIPLTHPYQDSKTINTQERIRENFGNNIVAIRERRLDETEDEFLDRFFDETLGV